VADGISLLDEAVTWTANAAELSMVKWSTTWEWTQVPRCSFGPVATLSTKRSLLI
jgi:hypothetical protein